MLGVLLEGVRQTRFFWRPVRQTRWLGERTLQKKRTHKRRNGMLGLERTWSEGRKRKHLPCKGNRTETTHNSSSVWFPSRHQPCLHELTVAFTILVYIPSNKRLEAKLKQTSDDASNSCSCWDLSQTNNLVGEDSYLFSSTSPMWTHWLTLSLSPPKDGEKISVNLICKYVFSFWNIWMQQEREVYVWDEPPSSCFLWRSQKSIQQTSKSNE